MFENDELDDDMINMLGDMNSPINSPVENNIINYVGHIKSIIGVLYYNFLNILMFLFQNILVYFLNQNT